MFQLKNLAGSPHPIAFDFATRLAERIFFPTVHIHDGTVHQEDVFDHMLYLQDARYDARAGEYVGEAAIDAKTGFVRSVARASGWMDLQLSKGIIAGDLLVHRLAMVGKHPNQDVIVDPGPALDAGAVAAGADAGAVADSKATPSRSACGRCDAAPSAGLDGLGPASAAIAGLAWVVRRRGLVGGRSRSK